MSIVDAVCVQPLALSHARTEQDRKVKVSAQLKARIGRPTWNGQPDEYCSLSCRQSAHLSCPELLLRPFFHLDLASILFVRRCMSQPEAKPQRRGLPEGAMGLKVFLHDWNDLAVHLRGLTQIMRAKVVRRCEDFHML